MGSGKHEFVIIVGPSHADAARASEGETIAILARCFEEASFDIAVIEADLVDGDYMLIPSRGSIGDHGSELRPMPPPELCKAIDAKLEELRFLQPPVLH